ncbi:MAG: sulfurtransferase-like selenium metabolism protein YedF [Desulfuromonadaceae bacterium]|nr:sulfurtransferase-like selenium metabolism protein YedF [Desulfuromonadaceae bacterium]MDD2853923.1 sulfurtransferase-like selenium metabolism protein YedF [Desulfuromonadaceae bacterium]
MANELDCRGMNCPAPVLQVRNTLEKGALASLTVLLDNEAARQNVCRFLENQNYEVSSEKSGDEYRVFANRGDLPKETAAVPSISPINKRGDAKRKIMVLVTGIYMGHGDDGLGDMLMFNFLKTLKEMGGELWRLSFVNSGVTFTVEGSEAVPILQELADSGVKITACGACLAYFHVLDKIQVGEVTNMLEIVNGMREADSVITV